MIESPNVCFAIVDVTNFVEHYIHIIDSFPISKIDQIWYINPIILLSEHLRN